MDNTPKTPVTSDNSTTNPGDNNQPPTNVTTNDNHQRTVAALNKEKRKRQSKPLLVIALALLVAILGGVATLSVYKYYFEDNNDRSSSASQSSDEDSKLTAARVISLISAEMTGETIADETAVPPAVKIAGKSFYSQFAASDPAVINTAELIPSSEADIERANLVKFMKDQGFEEKRLVSSNPETQQASEFTNKDVMCAMNHLMTLNNDAADHSISVACANMDTYKELADSHQPLLKAYESGNDVAPNTEILAIGEPKVTISNTPGYKTAVLSMSGYASGFAPALGGFQGMFYQSPDRVWHFFKGTQNNVPCSDYNTAELQKAYAGASCGAGDEKVTAPAA